MDEFRNKDGKKVVIVAIIANTFLTVTNIFIGLISGSYALISEGAHTLSDIATTFIAYAGFRIGQKPADTDHPLGHGRAEAISGLIIVLFLAFVAFEIITGAIEKIFDPKIITIPDHYAILMALLGVFINYFVSKYIIKIGESINSPAITADGYHQRTDVYSSMAILIGVTIANSGLPIIDPIIGLVIGLLILKTAYNIGKENIDNIMGKVPSKELINKIKEVANNTQEVENAHNIKVDYLGSYAVVSLHVELDGNLSLNKSHIIVHQVQKKCC